MEESKKLEIIKSFQDFFRNEVFIAHAKNTLKIAKVKKLVINPFTVMYLTNFYKGDITAKGIAEVLVLPRVLGTSISTTLGSAFQKSISNLFEDFSGSLVSGIDIEFVDCVDGQKKYCQVKLGPTTINKGDVKPILEDFQSAMNLARQNNVKLSNDNFVVGVIYGENSELSTHYKNIAKRHNVYVGSDFWYRLTGDKNFYNELIIAIHDVSKPVDGRAILDDVTSKLEKEIKAKYSL